MPEDSPRARLLEVATRLFGEKGYGATSVREVVEASGVTKPTLYYHFGSKEGLFRQAVEEHLQIFVTLVERSKSAKGTVRERLEHFVEAYIASTLENPHAVRFLLTIKHTPDDIEPTDQPRVDLLSLHLHHAQALLSLLLEGVENGEIRADLNLEVAVQGLLGMVNLSAMAAFHGHPVPDNHAHSLIDLFFHGVEAR